MPRLGNSQVKVVGWSALILRPNCWLAEFTRSEDESKNSRETFSIIYYLCLECCRLWAAEGDWGTEGAAGR